MFLYPSLNRYVDNVKRTIKEEKLFEYRNIALRSHNDLLGAFKFFLRLTDKILKKNKTQKKRFKQNNYKKEKLENKIPRKSELFSNYVFCSDMIRNETINSYIKKAMSNNLYERFGCNVLSSKDQIKTQYRIISRFIHPDKNNGLNNEHNKILTEAFQRLSKAYEILVGK